MSAEREEETRKIPGKIVTASHYEAFVQSVLSMRPVLDVHLLTMVGDTDTITE